MHRGHRFNVAVDRLRGAVALLALLGGEALAVLALTRLGDRAPFSIPHDVGRWLRAAPPVDVLAAVLRLVALGCAWWLLVTTTACILVRVCRLSAGVRLTAAVTLPSVRRAVDRALVVSVLVGTLAGAVPAARADTGSPGLTDPPVVVAGPDAPAASVRAGRTAGIAGLPGTTAVPPTTPVTTAASTTPTASPPPVAPPVAGSVTVVAGDNLWVIAARRLGAATGRDRASLSDEEIARYWVGVCEHNRPRLLSGDVNLIYPGEVVELPPV